MIKCVEFTRGYLGDESVSFQLQQFCNEHMITKDRIVSVSYSRSDQNIKAAALLVYEQD